ncbi:hypothetical protein LENED_011107 [Lentinula edodes]|uniref:Uncharacterized protein n=1 Tax=Lentinula edodes TaxID=5353 RepID=A0A1Q3EP48_LENED|nr:hypothetical protein LENED_011107 [Lentinula edodes]
MDDTQLHHLHAALQNDNTYLGSPANCPPGQGRWEDDGQKGLNFAHPKPPAIEHPISIVMCVVGKVSNINICMGPLGAHRVKKPDFKLSKTRKTIVLNCPAKTPFSRDWSTAEAKLNRTVALQTTEKPAFLWLEKGSPDELGSLKIGCPAFVIRDSTMPVDGRIMAAVPNNEKDDDDWKEIARNYTLAFVPVFDHHGNPIPQNDIQFSLLNATVLAKFTLRIYKWAGRRVNVTADIVSLSILYTSQALPRAVGVAPVDYTRLPQTPSRDLITHPELTPPNSVDGGQPYYHRDSSHTRTAAVRTPPSANVGRRNPYPTPLSSPFMLAHPPAAPSVYSHPQLRSPATTDMQPNLAMTPISRSPTPQMHIRNSYSDARPLTGSTVAEVQNHPYPYWPRIENGAHSQNDFAAFRLTQYAPRTTMNTVWPDYDSSHLTLRHDDIYHTPHVTQLPLTSPTRVSASGVGGTFRGLSASTGPVSVLPNGVTQRAATAPIPDLHSTPTKGSCEPQKDHPLQRAMQSGDDNTAFSGSPPSNRDIGLSIQNKEPKFTFDQALPVVGLDTQNVRNNSHIAYKNTARLSEQCAKPVQGGGIAYQEQSNVHHAGVDVSFDINHNVVANYMTQNQLPRQEFDTNQPNPTYDTVSDQYSFEGKHLTLVTSDGGEQTGVSEGHVDNTLNELLAFTPSNLTAHGPDNAYPHSPIVPAHGVLSPAPLPGQVDKSITSLLSENVPITGTVGKVA